MQWFFHPFPGLSGDRPVDQILKMENPHSTAVFLVHRQRLVRDVLPGALHLRDEIRVVGQSEDFEDAVRQLDGTPLEKEVKVVLFDVALGGGRGLEALRRLRKILPTSRFVAIGLRTPEDADPFIRLGIKSFVPPGAKLSGIVQAVQEHANITSEMLDRLIGAISEREPAPPEEDLTPREFETLQYLAEGISYKDIADRMSISETTVDSYVRNILRKLEVPNRRAALDRAVQVGWILGPYGAE